MKRALVLSELAMSEVSEFTKKIKGIEAWIKMTIGTELYTKLPEQYKPFLTILTEGTETMRAELEDFIFTDLSSSLYESGEAEFLPGIIVRIRLDHFEAMGIGRDDESLGTALTAIGTHINLSIVLIRVELGIVTISIKNIWQ